jgi:hypothetical protein
MSGVDGSGLPASVFGCDRRPLRTANSENARSVRKFFLRPQRIPRLVANITLRVAFSDTLNQTLQIEN